MTSLNSTSGDSTVRVRWFAGVLLAACFLLVACQLADARGGAIAAKLIASSAFLAIALDAGALRSGYGGAVLAALVFSWFGDAFLLGHSERFFQFGLISFLLAHIAYLIAFTLHGLNIRWLLGALLPVGLGSLGAISWLLPHVPESMRLPVSVYTFVISLMVAAAFATRGAGGAALIPAGAALFYLSDLSVAAGQFVQPAFPNYVWGLPFYYVGQLLLARSIAGIGPAGRTP